MSIKNSNGITENRTRKLPACSVVPQPTVLSSGAKRSGCEPDHSSPPSAGLQNARTYAFTPPYIFKAWGQLYLYYWQ